jgi:NAD(P)-dependent dehydrogenase (short-subunit alcohol dehydrogenase family)
MARLAGKVAIVTGAGSIGPGWSNGRAVAVTFAREGACVLAMDLDAASVSETQAIIRAEGGICETAVGSVARDGDVAACVATALQTFGGIDILHNNVGIYRLGGPVELSEVDWDLVLATNLKGLFLTSKHVLPCLERRGGGAIVTIGSIAGRRHMGLPQIAYATSKGAVAAFTRGIAAQYGPSGIRANVVVPGIIDTPLLAKAAKAAYASSMGLASIDAMRAARAQKVPLTRFGTAWDVAAASLYLVSDDARYVTGAEIVVDGGLSCLAP